MIFIAYAKIEGFHLIINTINEVFMAYPILLILWFVKNEREY